MSSNRALRKEQRRVSIYTQLHPPRSSDSSDASEDDSVDSGHHHASDSDMEDAAQPLDLDESWPYAFQAGDKVWVRIAEDDWRCGEVFGNKTKCGPTREVCSFCFCNDIGPTLIQFLRVHRRRVRSTQWSSPPTVFESGLRR